MSAGSGHDSPLDIDYEPRLPPEEKRRKALVIAFILLSVALAAAAQLTLKFGVDRVTEHGRSGIVLAQPLASALRVVREPFVWGGLFLFAMSAAVWIVVLSRTALSFAYPFAALTYVLILVADRILLGVDVPALRWAGVALIVTGIVLISRTGHAT
jgi:multidrug transporter EmrE-like cation transporter